MSARAQEHILNGGVAADARVALLEAVRVNHGGPQPQNHRSTCGPSPRSQEKGRETGGAT